MLTKLIQEESGDNINIKVEEEPLTKKSRVSGKYCIMILTFKTTDKRIYFNYI